MNVCRTGSDRVQGRHGENGNREMKEKESYIPMFWKAKSVQIMPTIHTCRYKRPVVGLHYQEYRSYRRQKKKTDITRMKEQKRHPDQEAISLYLFLNNF